MDDNVKKILIASGALVIAIVIFLVLRPKSGPTYNTEIQRPKPMGQLMQQSASKPGGQGGSLSNTAPPPPQ